MMAYFITGAGHLNGLGGALALHLLESGKSVVINGRNIDDKWYEYKMLYADRLHIVVGDITDPKIQKNFIDEANDLDGIHALINNASSVESDVRNREDWQYDYLINVIVPFELSLKAEQFLRKNNGCIINIGSRVGIQATKSVANLSYATSKSALHYLTTTLAVNVYPNIRVNAIAPAFFESDRLHQKLQQEFNARSSDFEEQSILKTPIKLEELVKPVMFLIESKNITGQILPICNGSSINSA
jgi:3-oxoacyl-[acyl-carrier protein] reductase